MTLVTPDEIKPPQPPQNRQPYFIMIALGILASLYILLPDFIPGPIDDIFVLLLTILAEYRLGRRRS